MRLSLVIAVAILVAAGAAWYLVRFVQEYRKIERELRQIRESGQTKSAIRRMKREIARGRRRGK